MGDVAHACWACSVPILDDDETAAMIPDGWLCGVCVWESEGRGDPDVQDQS